MHRASTLGGVDVRDPRGEWDWPALRRVAVLEAAHVLGRGPSAEDAAQEALLRAWRRRAGCRTPDDPGPWMRAIARREALRLAGRRTDLADTLPDAGAVDPDPTLAIDVLRAVAQLDPAQAQVVALRYWRDLTQAEVAQRLGIPSGTARIRLHRARARLRERLAGYGDSVPTP